MFASLNILITIGGPLLSYIKVVTFFWLSFAHYIIWITFSETRVGNNIYGLAYSKLTPHQSLCPGLHIPTDMYRSDNITHIIF